MPFKRAFNRSLAVSLLEHSRHFPRSGSEVVTNFKNTNSILNGVIDVPLGCCCAGHHERLEEEGRLSFWAEMR